MSDDQAPVTVLLVDDEENILRALQRLLMDEDYEVETATSGEAGLDKLRTLENVGLIVSDQRMPGMNGADFLGRSQEIAPFAQRILLTGYSDINATIDAINKGGASLYISKPWDDAELVAAIRAAIEQYLSGAEKRRLNDIISKQKQELEEWNDSLKKRLLKTTTTIREQSQALKSLDEHAPVVVVGRTFDNFFEVMGDRNATHARTVSTLVTDVARKMGLDSETVSNLRLAALLHDLGKFGTIALNLHKNIDEMSESELTEYKLHPIRSEEMLRQVDELAAIGPMIRGHHESYDGSGFPDRLSGDSIPLGSRMIAIANQIEKSARSVEHNRAEYALMNARYRAGTTLDPNLIARFQGITRVVYFEGRKSSMLSEVEVRPYELVPGMVVARDVVSGAGVLLTQRGSVLDLASIVLIRSHYRKNPPSDGIYVQVQEV